MEEGVALCCARCKEATNPEYREVLKQGEDFIGSKLTSRAPLYENLYLRAQLHTSSPSNAHSPSSPRNSPGSRAALALVGGGGGFAGRYSLSPSPSSHEKREPPPAASPLSSADPFLSEPQLKNPVGALLEAAGEELPVSLPLAAAALPLPASPASREAGGGERAMLRSKVEQLEAALSSLRLQLQNCPS
jgi:hypothetical protein